MRFSGLVVSPLHRPSELANLPVRSSARGIKARSFPLRRFFHTSVNPLFFFPSPARPSCLRPLQAPPFSTPAPLGSIEGYDRRMFRRDCRFLFADPFGSIV